MAEEVIFDDEEDSDVVEEDPLFSEEENDEVERIIWDEDGINENFDREVFN